MSPTLYMTTTSVKNPVNSYQAIEAIVFGLSQVGASKVKNDLTEILAIIATGTPRTTSDGGFIFVNQAGERVEITPEGLVSATLDGRSIETSFSDLEAEAHRIKVEGNRTLAHKPRKHKNRAKSEGSSRGQNEQTPVSSDSGSDSGTGVARTELVDPALVSSSVDTNDAAVVSQTRPQVNSTYALACVEPPVIVIDKGAATENSAARFRQKAAAKPRVLPGNTPVTTAKEDAESASPLGEHPPANPAPGQSASDDRKPEGEIAGGTSDEAHADSVPATGQPASDDGKPKDAIANGKPAEGSDSPRIVPIPPPGDTSQLSEACSAAPAASPNDAEEREEVASVAGNDQGEEAEEAAEGTVVAAITENPSTGDTANNDSGGETTVVGVTGTPNDADSGTAAEFAAPEAQAVRVATIPAENLAVSSVPASLGSATVFVTGPVSTEPAAIIADRCAAAQADAVAANIAQGAALALGEARACNAAEAKKDFAEALAVRSDVRRDDAARLLNVADIKSGDKADLGNFAKQLHGIHGHGHTLTSSALYIDPSSEKPSGPRLKFGSALMLGDPNYDPQTIAESYFGPFGMPPLIFDFSSRDQRMVEKGHNRLSDDAVAEADKKGDSGTRHGRDGSHKGGHQSGGYTWADVREFMEAEEKKLA